MIGGGALTAPPVGGAMDSQSAHSFAGHSRQHEKGGIGSYDGDDDGNHDNESHRTSICSFFSSTTTSSSSRHPDSGRLDLLLVLDSLTDMQETGFKHRARRIIPLCMAPIWTKRRNIILVHDKSMMSIPG